MVSLNEVGGEPEDFGVSAAEFHLRSATRARLWPRAMVTTSTHDTKRSEDVRARIGGVLSQAAEVWSERIRRWSHVVLAPDEQTAAFLWQNIFGGVWPADGDVTDALRTRLHAYAEKAIREAGTHTTWNDPPDDEFESAVHAWLDSIIDGPPVATELTALVGQLGPHGISDAIGQKLLALTVPGIPRCLPGTELPDDSLVDPDNRRPPVDYEARRAALADGSDPKIRVVHAALRLRRDKPDTFLAGGHHPLQAQGTAADHVVAYLRGDDVLVAVTRWTLRLGETGWGETTLTLPPGDLDRPDRWPDVHRHGAGGELFGELPVSLLERAA